MDERQSIEQIKAALLAPHLAGDTLWPALADHSAKDLARACGEILDETGGRVVASLCYRLLEHLESKGALP